MRLPSTAAAVALLLVLLTWLALRGMDPDAPLFDRAGRSLSQLDVAESALRRDILSARAGLLRDYDPLVEEVAALDDALGGLRAAALAGAGGAAGTAAVDVLAASIDREEDLTERFKSDNALLQNSLAYFRVFSARLSASTRDSALAPAVSRLAGTMMRFVLDTSPLSAHEVQDRLDDLAALPLPSDDPDPVLALLAHGRMLRDLLPETDGLLRALLTIPSKSEQEAFGTMVSAKRLASGETARRFRLLLYAASLLLVSLLVHLGLQLRDRARALRSRAAFEHLIAGISTRFIGAGPTEIDVLVEEALRLLAWHVGADRAYFVLAGPPARVHVWCREGIDCPSDWPAQALAAAGRLPTTAEGIIRLPPIDRLFSDKSWSVLTAAGLQQWACVPMAHRHGPTTSGNGLGGILGFDTLPPRRFEHACQLGLLRMALDAIANAVGRGLLEQERTRLEMRLQQAQRMETVGALASGIAHNFNNIIGAILGYSEMAQATLASGSRSDWHLGEINRAAERARDLVDQILTFGRRRDARHQAVSVPALVADAASLLEASLPPGIELVVRQAPQAAAVSGEYSLLQQIILNLCTNAAAAMDGAGRIELDTEIQDIAQPRVLTHGELAPGRHMRIVVSDFGRGMDEATLARIFEPFFTTRRAGNGLGLATVREIMREHGGAMDVHSIPGAGSRFEAWLPCLEAAALDLPEAPTLPLGRGETLLVVDEDAEQLLRSEELLAALGYEPIGFASGDEALAAYRAAPQRFDAVVVGHLAAAAEPIDLASAMHQVQPAMPIMLATRGWESIGGHELAAAGISEIVTRPVASVQMASALERCLPRR